MTDEAQRSARDALSKIADEVQSRRAELAHRLGLEGTAGAAKADVKSAADDATASGGTGTKPSVETLIQAAVEALGPRYDTPSRVVAVPQKPIAEKSAAPAKEPESGIVSAPDHSKPATEAPSFAPPVQVISATESPLAAAVETPQTLSEQQHPAAVAASADRFLADQAATAPAAAVAAAPAVAASTLTAAEAAALPAHLSAPNAPSASLASRTTHAIVHGLDQPHARSVAATYFPMLIAVLALAAALYQGYLFRASLDVVQGSVARGDYARACRDLVESYYGVKQKIGALMPAADRSNVAGASRVTEYNRIDAQAAVARFGALGTYLAAVQEPGTRARFTELMRTLTGMVDAARTTQLSDIDKMFDPADKLFAVMNDDCARRSQPTRL